MVNADQQEFGQLETTGRVERSDAQKTVDREVHNTTFDLMAEQREIYRGFGCQECRKIEYGGE